MNYREYKEGDTIRITGCQGRLFRHFGDISLNNGVSLGVECVLVGGEDDQHDVQLPRGILAEDQTYISLACIELVQAVEDKPLIVEHKDEGPDSQLYIIDDTVPNYAIARIWYDPNQLPTGVVKEFVDNIKDIVSKRKANNAKSIIENKTELTNNKPTTNEEKFIKLCETSDFVLVNGYLGKYLKEYEKIIFIKYALCPPSIKVRDYDYYEEKDGERWILPRDCKVGGYHVSFLNEVKN